MRIDNLPEQIDMKKKNLAKLTTIHAEHPEYALPSLIAEWKLELTELEQVHALHQKWNNERAL